jgi:iron complex outermembrane receptor protein
MFFRKLTLICLIAICISTVSNAQTSIYTASLDSIVVQVGRQDNSLEMTPYSVDKVDSILIVNANNLTTVKEFFSTVPGVIVDNRFNQSQGDRIVIRGIGARAQFGTRGIKILLDNIPLTFPDGQSQLNNLDPANIESIELLRGPSSSLYGNASGGIISIKSNDNISKSLQVTPSINLGSFGFSRYGLNASGGLFNGSFSFSGFTASSDGFRDHSESKYSGLNLITTQTFNKILDLSFVVNYYTAPYLLNASSLNKSDAENNPTKARGFIVGRGAGKEVEQFQTGISFNYQPSLVTEVNTTIYGIWRSLFNPIPNRIIELKRFSYGIRSTFSYKPVSFSNIKLLFGFDHEIQDDERNEFENEGLSSNTNIAPDKVFDQLQLGDELQNQNEFVRSTGFFVKVDYSPIQNLIVSGGLRYDYFLFEVEDKFMNDNSNDSGSRNLDQLSPTLGTSYKFNNNFIFFGNYSTSFQTPTTNELSNTPDGAGGFNKSLDPETIQSYELGLRGKFEQLGISYSAAFYRMFINNMILPYENQFEETYYRNSGKTINNGLELQLNWQAAQFLSTTISYTHQNFKFDDLVVTSNGNDIQLKNNFVPAIPKHLLNISLYTKIIQGLSSQININTRSKVFTNDLNGPPPNSSEPNNSFINKGYTTVGINLNYQIDLPIGLVKIQSGIENLFNKRYNSSIVPNAFGNNFFEPGAGRNYLFGIQLAFNK